MGIRYIIFHSNKIRQEIVLPIKTLIKGMREMRESLPYRQIVSDEDFINIIKHNSIKWEQVKKVHLQPVTLTVRGC